MAKKLFSAIEELEVDKLHRETIDANRSGEFDTIYQNVKQNIEAKDEAEVENETDETPDAGNTTEDAIDAGAEDVNTDDVNVATESFLQHYRRTNVSIAQESEMLRNVGGYIGDKSLSGLVYLKDIGFQYGPVLAQHIYKGVLKTLNMAVKGIVQGTVSISNYIKKKINSYKNLKADLDDIEATLKMLEDNEVEAKFTKPTIINQLKIGNNYDFNANIQTADKFFRAFFNGFDSNVRGNIAVTRNIVDSVIKHRTVPPSKITYDKFSFTNFVRRNVDGYVPESSNVDTYSYQYVLPGDMVFAAWIPKPNLPEHDLLVDAFNNSKMFIGVNAEHVKVQDEVEMLSLDDLKAMVTTLKSICDYGIQLDKSYDKVIKDRNSLRSVLNIYTRFLMTSQKRVSVKESLADLIMLKLAYVDRTYIAGSMYINDYMNRLVTVSLSYLKEAIKIYS